MSTLAANAITMKKVLPALFSFILLAFQPDLFANTVIVKGYVSDSANHAIANRTVRIYSTDSTNTSCLIAHSVTTNPNGYYIDTLHCTGDIRAIQVIVENCDGSKLIQQPVISASNILECNFKLSCVPLPLSCKAAFSYKSLPSGISFTSAGSIAAPGDSIIARTWQFGDSSAALTGNRLDPSHTYLHPGTYQVCLTIATRGGCSSSYCQSVSFTPTSDSCHTEVHVTTEKISARSIRFNSVTTIIQTGDSIFQRIWNFGDGSSQDGNIVNPLKNYQDTGNFTACLTIHTIKGCSGQLCIQVPVHDTVPVSNT
ncbi:MAG TPA: PKD domain-containing protein, partial [Sediminibacterium sp.]|nr:PKD domain-containing protein [Sediminibacterium sp.]